MTLITLLLGTKASAADVNANFLNCLRPAGDYDALTTYAKNDLVKHSGARYFALAAVTGVTPGTDATKWEQF